MINLLSAQRKLFKEINIINTMSWFTEEEKERLDRQGKLNEIDYKLTELVTEMTKYIVHDEQNLESSKLKGILEAT